MDSIAGLWNDLQKTNKVPQDGVLLAHCESELQNLMKQIDLMLHNKRMEWEREKQSLSSRASLKEQEAALHKSALDHKAKEVTSLRNKVENFERVHTDMMLQHESHLNKLRDEVNEMKKAYEKLQKKFHRQTRDSMTSKQKAAEQLHDSMAEVNRLQHKLQEFQQKSLDWEEERKTYQRQIDSLEAQRKALTEKCDLIQHQSVSYQSQLGKRQELLVDTESSWSSQVKQLQSQLDRARDTVTSQESQITRLQKSVDESLAAQRRTLEEKEELHEQLQKAQDSIRKLEEEISNLQSSMQLTSNSLKIADQSEKKLNQSLSRLEQSVVDKDAKIQELERQSQQEQVERDQQLQVKLLAAKDESRIYKKREKQLIAELDDIGSKLEESRHECTQLHEDLAAKMEYIYTLEDKNKKLSAEVSKLKKKNSQLESSHASALSSLSQELSAAKTDLNQRNISMAALSERVATMERQIREQNDNLDRKAAEVEVVNAQLEALRLENRHLRKAALNKGSTETSEVQQHLKEIQEAYGTSLTKLEEENRKLHSDIAALRDELRSSEVETQRKVQGVLRETERTLQNQKAEEDRRVTDTELASRKRMEMLQDHLDTTVQDYESRLRALEAEKSGLEEELESQNRSFRRMGLEHEVMSDFAVGIDGIVTQPPHRDTSFRTPQRAPLHSHSSAFTPIGGEEDAYYEFSENRVSLMERFLLEEEERAKELERKLDLHIEELRDNTENKINKYHSS